MMTLASGSDLGTETQNLSSLQVAYSNPSGLSGICESLGLFMR